MRKQSRGPTTTSLRAASRRTTYSGSGPAIFEAFALTDRVIDDAVVAAEATAVDVHDVAGLQRAGLQALDDAGVAARRHEANVLAVGLFGNGQPELARELRAPRALRHAAERKPQVAEAARGVVANRK